MEAAGQQNSEIKSLWRAGISDDGFHL